MIKLYRQRSAESPTCVKMRVRQVSPWLAPPVRRPLTLLEIPADFERNRIQVSFLSACSFYIYIYRLYFVYIPPVCTNTQQAVVLFVPQARPRLGSWQLTALGVGVSPSSSLGSKLRAARDHRMTSERLHFLCCLPQ
jgi:hypothetical protein